MAGRGGRRRARRARRRRTRRRRVGRRRWRRCRRTGRRRRRRVGRRRAVIWIQACRVRAGSQRQRRWQVSAAHAIQQVHRHCGGAVRKQCKRSGRRYVGTGWSTARVEVAWQAVPVPDNHVLCMASGSQQIEVCLAAGHAAARAALHTAGLRRHDTIGRGAAIACHPCGGCRLHVLGHVVKRRAAVHGSKRPSGQVHEVKAIAGHVDGVGISHNHRVVQSHEIASASA